MVIMMLLQFTENVARPLCFWTRDVVSCLSQVLVLDFVPVFLVSYAYSDISVER